MIEICLKNLSSFDLNLLKVLDALLREQSTVRAGQRIGLSQPAVSAALGRLRAAFGDPLLIRDGQGLQLTEFALTLRAPVRALLEDATAVLARPVFDPQTATDTFRLAAPDFFTQVLLPDLMARLERDAPGITLRYSDAIGRTAIDDLRDGRIDLLFVPAHVLSPGLESEFLFEPDYRVIARRGHPEVQRHGVRAGDPMPIALFCVLRHAVFRVTDDEPEAHERFMESNGFVRKTAMRAPSFTPVWQAVAATDMIGIIPRQLAERVAPSAGLDMFQLPFDLPKEEMHQAWHRRNSGSRGLIWLRSVVASLLTAVDRGPMVGA
jgi:DNA-binding transcriptional LysR family regulator